MTIPSHLLNMTDEELIEELLHCEDWEDPIIRKLLSDRGGFSE